VCAPKVPLRPKPTLPGRSSTDIYNSAKVCEACGALAWQWRWVSACNLACWDLAICSGDGEFSGVADRAIHDLAKRPRRRVLKVTATALSVLAVGGGFAFWGTRRPQIDLARPTCPMDTRGRDMILVAYASRCGSTGEVAQAIAKSLCERGLDADARPVGEVASLEKYRAVVVGSKERTACGLELRLARLRFS
jgi:Flavodoxin domain